MVQDNRAQANALVDRAIWSPQEAVGIGEWEFMGLMLTLTAIFHVIRLTSNFALSTLE